MKHPLQRYFEKFPGVTRKAFAERAEISRMQLWRLMNGRGEFSTALLKRVSRATDNLISVTELAAALSHKQAPKATEAA